MRLAVGIVILIISALDFRFGRPGTGLHIVGSVVGVLLALSVIVDWLRCRSDAPVGEPDARRDERLPSKPG